MNCTMFQEALEQAGLPVDAFSVYRAKDTPSRLMPCIPSMLFVSASPAGMETMCCLPRTIKPGCSMTCASAARNLALMRAHWWIENRLHWRRDVTLQRNHIQVGLSLDQACQTAGPGLPEPDVLL